MRGGTGAEIDPGMMQSGRRIDGQMVVLDNPESKTPTSAKGGSSGQRNRSFGDEVLEPHTF